MKERGVLFTGEKRGKVRSGARYGAGLTTQTRRVTTPPFTDSKMCPAMIVRDAASPSGYSWQSDMYGTVYAKPRYQVGDHLYMKEPYRVYDGYVVEPNDSKELTVTYLDDDQYCDKISVTSEEWVKWNARKNPCLNTSSMFMYKSLARTWLEVTEVRVERVQDITHADILREGINAEMEPKTDYPDNIKKAWIELWNSINATPKPKKNKDGEVTHYVSYPWDDSGKFAKMKTYRGKPHLCYPNPWVFVYVFKRIEKEQSK